MIALLLSLVWAAGDEPKSKISLPPETQRIVDLARSTAPEIFADAVVRLIQAGRVPQPGSQIELLGQAFAAAGHAKEPVRLIALPATPPDTRELYRARAGDLGLDALSLESRVLRELATLNPVHARELFDTIPRPALDPRPCEDPLIADAATYYEAAAVIAQSSFSREERHAEAHIQFLSAILSGARSPGELAPFARSLDSISLEPAEWEVIAAAFAARLNSIGADYRAFALSFESLQSEIRAMEHISHSPDLDQAFRKFAVAQLTAPRCTPDLSISPEMQLEPKETAPTARLGDFKTSDPYLSGTPIGDLLLHLTRDSAFDGFLHQYDSWTPTGDNLDALHQRATALGAMMQFLQPGDDRDRVTQLAAEMLAASSAQQTNPAEWMWQTRHLIELAAGDAPKLLAAFRASGDPALGVYASLRSAP